MSSALLSRFDLVFVLLDHADEGRDRLISEHIMRTYQTSSSMATPSGCAWSSNLTNDDDDIIDNNNDDDDVTLTQRLRRQSSIFINNHIPPNIFRDYIAYAKKYCHPQMTPPAAKVLQRLYLSMRTQATLGDSVPVTTRHLESLIRLAQARAKLELREEVIILIIYYIYLIYIIYNYLIYKIYLIYDYIIYIIYIIYNYII